jgi:hypothetical protein
MRTIRRLVITALVAGGVLAAAAPVVTPAAAPAAITWNAQPSGVTWG